MSAPSTHRKPPSRTYVVQIAGKAEKQLSKLPKHLGRLVANAIAKLADNPFPPGSKQLQGNDAEILHRIRVGDYRVIYEVRRTQLVVLVVKVGKLDEVDLVAMFIDGIEFAGHSVLIALGVTIDGTKTPLGIWAGSTENTTVVTELLSTLVARGLRVEQSMLFVIDGGKAIRKALRDVFGDRAIIQRCQVHKARNVRDHLPEARRAYVARQIRDAYDSATATTARKKLLQLASWLDSNGHDDAAASLREGLDETLTVMRLGLTGTLRRTFATTNPIENMNGSLRRVTRNVKRWKDEAMIRRWVALGIAEAQKGFRRVKGYVHMPSLVAALRPAAATVASEKKVA